jgi:branched-chain amino acid aminotransferase
MYCEQVWLNGDFFPLTSVNVSITSHSLHYASSVFEGIMAYEGRVFRIEEHIKRLFASAKTMYLHVNFSFEEIEKVIAKLLDLNDCKNGLYYIRPLIWPNAQSFIKRDANIPANVAIFAQKHIPAGIKKSVRLLVSSWVKGPSNSIPHQCKGSGNYMNSILSKQEAAALGFDDSLLLDYEGNVAEAASANIFFITQDGGLVTPKTQHCLSGVTRKVVLEIAAKLGIQSTEKDIAIDEIQHFTGAFLTGTAIELQPIESINFATENKVINFQNLELVQTLHEEYKQLVLL